MRRFPPREEPPERRLRRDLPRPEGPFDRLLRRKPERDPAPIIIGGTIAFLAIVIVLVFLFSSVLGGGGGNGGGSSGAVDIAPGIKGRLAPMPALPPGLVALSEFIEFQAKNKGTPAIIGLPLKERVQDTAGIGFYTYFEGRWQRLGEASVKDGKVAEGDFPSVPDNVAVLRVVAQAYQVAASIPANTSLHPEAKFDILNPRDYAPAPDGSVKGTATKLPEQRSYAVMPTIVGSSADTAPVVKDILLSEDLRDAHVKAIAALVQSGGFDGIDLEYSSVDVGLGGPFTEFVQSLAATLHKSGKRLSLTLPPPSSQRQPYDWKALGEAADIIKILPIADPVVYWQTMPEAMTRLVKDVDPAKVMLVLSPFSVDTARGGAHPIGYLQAMVLAAQAVVREPKEPKDIQPGVTVKLMAKNMDESEGASALRWSDDAAAVSFAPGGQDSRRIYIENIFSFGFKLEIVQSYGLGGVAVADASAQSDVANVWPSVRELVESGTVTLRRPNDAMLLPTWQAPDGGDLGAGAGTTATWIPPKEGFYGIILVVSDGERRFGRRLTIEVGEAPKPSVTPLVTFPPESPTPTPTPTPVETPTPTPTGSGAAGVAVEVGMRADGDDPDADFTNEETVSPESSVKYLVTIDNDSDLPVSITSLLDNFYGEVECLTPGGLNVVGEQLAADDGDGVGAFNGGADEIQCTFTQTAPSTPGTSVTNTVTVVVSDDNGNSRADQDGAKITVS